MHTSYLVLFINTGFVSRFIPLQLHGNAPDTLKPWMNLTNLASDALHSEGFLLLPSKIYIYFSFKIFI